MKKIRVNITEILFVIGYVLIISELLLANVTFLNEFNKIIGNIGIIILLFKILIDRIKYTKKELLLLFIVLGIVTLSAYFSKDTLMLKLCVSIISAHRINIKRVIKIDFIVRIISVIFVIICYKLQLTNPILIAKSDGTIRNSFGFSHPNMLGMMLFILCSEMVYLNIPKNKVVKIIIIILNILINHFFIVSYTSEIAIMFLLVFFIFWNKEKIVKNKFRLISLLPIFIFAISLYLTYLYNINDLLGVKLNRILSNRLYYYNLFMNKYPITLFGTKIDIIYSSNNNIKFMVLDNSYLFILLRYGIIVFTIFMYSLIKLVNLIMNKFNNKIVVMIMLIYIVISFSETYLFKIHFNPFILYFSSLLFNKTKEEL